MNLPEDCHLAYIVGHEAWYAKAAELPGEHPYITVKASSDGGGIAWEFKIEQRHLGGKDCTRLAMFDDAYEAMGQIPELFEYFALEQPLTLDDVRRQLDALGAADETERVSPYGEPGPNSPLTFTKEQVAATDWPASSRFRLASTGDPE